METEKLKQQIHDAYFAEYVRTAMKADGESLPEQLVSYDEESRRMIVDSALVFAFGALVATAAILTVPPIMAGMGIVASAGAKVLTVAATSIGACLLAKRSAAKELKRAEGVAEKILAEDIENGTLAARYQNEVLPKLGLPAAEKEKILTCLSTLSAAASFTEAVAGKTDKPATAQVKTPKAPGHKA